MYYTRGLNVSIIFVMVANNISTVEILDEGDSEFLICCKDPFEKVELWCFGSCKLFQYYSSIFIKLQKKTG